MIDMRIFRASHVKVLLLDVTVFYIPHMNTISGLDTISLIGENDPPVFDVVSARASCPLFIVADHAGRAFPDAMNTLGLAPSHLDMHIAYDIGTRRIATSLAKKMQATAVIANYSRLLIDLNRAPGHPQSIPAVSDCVTIPGNQDVGEIMQHARRKTFFTPYHRAIHRHIETLEGQGTAPVVFSVHSFTPHMNGTHRPWEIGVLWNRDPRLAIPLMDKLRQSGRLNVGDNAPYSGRDVAYTMEKHAGSRGLPHCAVEIRQDLCATPDDCDRWAGLLANVLTQILAEKKLYRSSVLAQGANDSEF
ncbi:N-formylglutamate amidohydrolase [Varunaivibrio sulfuroxidans]|uniref:Putative N-formylglutamate amidohydrolase n=1 Tax=Varunaivibrio sulfuroxidans TaxID=1773489 RepID=A0A4R3J9K6_9PROT|nr:N-formylglutamate amidohydrolase [Varunaivibrio sulfuroxidans]TCS62639.1 putative N-formylglutamate amidohydrolase [Varunaivibrio sulfuroxidans]WES30695.1 N-formylglutamate amidohydrolase [Varunaivibrio sulfuroxidans]